MRHPMLILAVFMGFKGVFALASIPQNPADEKAFRKVVSILKKKNYSAAVLGFDQFSRSFPTSPLASLSKLLAGESFLELRNAQEARRRFEDVILAGTSVQVPAALFGLAKASSMAQDSKSVQRYLMQLWSLYPASKEFGLAKKMFAKEFQQFRGQVKSL